MKLGIGRRAKSPIVNSLERIVNMERLLKLEPFLLFLVPGLLAFIFFVKVNIPWERVNIYWLMALIFHIPLLLFFTAAILMEIIDSMERRDKRLYSKE
jgi:glucan phosphoethanolaminetransferase (alkaline phosphatase superfamily)